MAILIWLLRLLLHGEMEDIEYSDESIKGVLMIYPVEE